MIQDLYCSYNPKLKFDIQKTLHPAKLPTFADCY
jgi:hypothetical protein